MTHGINVQTFVAHCEANAPPSHVKAKRYTDYCGIGSASVLGNSLRMTHGGSNFQLRNFAAENHLEERLGSSHFANQAVKNSAFD